jgi:uncharacterized protein YaaQ
MKLLIAVVQDQDATRLLQVLMEKGFSATKLASTGGFLREGNTTLLLGVDDDRIEEVIDLVRNTCKTREQFITPMLDVSKPMNPYVHQPIEVSVGGATIFVLNVERFEKV